VFLRLILVFFGIQLLFYSNLKASVSYSDDEFMEFDTKKSITPDPWEKINRKIFTFNIFIDSNILVPVAKKYVAVTSDSFRFKVTSFLINVNTPSDIIISLIQGDGQSIGILCWRFVINTTIGLFGIFDVASEFGLKPIPKYFGDTLALHGVKMGNYMMLPFLGPSFVRNFGDIPIKFALNTNINNTIPIAYRVFKEDSFITNTLKNDVYGYSLGLFFILDTRVKLLSATEDVNQGSSDMYAIYRDVYYQYVKFSSQNRLNLIKNGTFSENIWHNTNINDASEFCIQNPNNDECKTYFND